MESLPDFVLLNIAVLCGAEDINKLNYCLSKETCNEVFQLLIDIVLLNLKTTNSNTILLELSPYNKLSFFVNNDQDLRNKILELFILNERYNKNFNLMIKNYVKKVNL